MPKTNVNPFQPSTSPWDQSFAAGGARGTILFPGAVPPNGSPLVPIIQHTNYNVAGLNIPNPPPGFWAQTVIQLTMNGPDAGTTFTDQKFGTTPSTLANATTDSATSVFGGSSGKFDGVSNAGGGILFLTSTKWDLGANPFTLEGWFKTAATQANTELVAHSNSTFGAGSWSLTINSNGLTDGLLNWYADDFNGATTFMMRSSAAYNDGVWHHVAVVRNGATWTLYVDGVRDGTVTSNVALVASSYDLIFGNGHFATRTLLGNMNMWRLIAGAAAYTGARFFVPTSPFPTS